MLVAQLGRYAEQLQKLDLLDDDAFEKVRSFTKQAVPSARIGIRRRMREAQPGGVETGGEDGGPGFEFSEAELDQFEASLNFNVGHSTGPGSSKAPGLSGHRERVLFRKRRLVANAGPVPCCCRCSLRVVSYEPARALRLYQHAKLLAVAHHDAAAEERYLSSARLAASHRRQRLAAHALTRLAYFYLLRGRHQEALTQASEALTHATDPLAQYIQATQRRGLGLLRTEEDAKFAEEQLAQIAGKLPSQALEEKRQAAWEELNSWRQAAEGGIAACLGMSDAARVLICGFCKIAFGVFPPGLTEDNNNLLGVAGQD
ncbi:unnamed protein product [Prorocentrum cordatum]|uniref:Uncharacterized protein n=1 Tax=Prorocentrum cordatum TaxID=2364126 RepID=A0ABN9WG17_9DINO|nr:unnamed protein product [Polarella glacialis]